MTRITNLVGQEVVDAMELMGKEVGKMTDAAAKEFEKFYLMWKEKCRRIDR